MVTDLSEKQINALLNLGLDEKVSVDEIIRKLSSISSREISNHLAHQFFSLKFFPRVDQILKQWTGNNTTLLNENDSTILQYSSRIILQMSTLINNPLENDKSLLDTIKICLNNISSFGFYIKKLNQEEDFNLASFDSVIHAYGNVKCKFLIDAVTRCVTSRYSADALSGITGLPLTNTEHFLLVTCPDYVLDSNEENGKYAHSIFVAMRSSYFKLFGCSKVDLNDLINIYSSCLVSPLRLIAFTSRSLEFNEKQLIKSVALKILEHGLVNANSNVSQIIWKRLVQSSFKILLEIGRSASQLINDIQKNKESFPKVLNTLLKLSCDEQNEDIQLQVFELIAIILSEEQFSGVVDIKKVVRLFVTKFVQAIDNDTNEDEKCNSAADELLYGLKNMIENTLIREELVEQNSLPYLIKYANKWPTNELPLEIIYALAFTTKGKEELKKDQYKGFIDHLKILQLSSKVEVQQAAHGISWKLGGEIDFIDIIEHQNEKSQATSEYCQLQYLQANGNNRSSQNSLANTFHMMISYCWKNKTLCRQIHERLAHDGYRVWIDDKEMYGSIVERMAEAIEKSQVILICMSSSYKKSVNCQAEAEYAFNRKKLIVPLIVESKYRADGWLGFIVGNKIYVNFADKLEDEFEAAYKMLVIELQHNGINLLPPPSNIHYSVKELDRTQYEIPKPSLTETPTQIQPKKNIYVPLPAASTQINYHHIERIESWDETHVIDFLVGNNLKKLLPMLKDIDGQGLVELYRVYERSPKNLYKLFNMNGHSSSLGTFFKFIGLLKNLVQISEQNPES